MDDFLKRLERAALEAGYETANANNVVGSIALAVTKNGKCHAVACRCPNGPEDFLAPLNEWFSKKEAA